LKQNKFTSTWFRQAVIAYVDNTTWLANSKEQLKEMLRVAKDFYFLNDIQINIAKSKLLVINSSTDLIANLWQEELQPFDLRIWQNNLNCQIIYKAKELNLTIRHESDFWQIHETGPHFHKVLEPKHFIKAHRNLQSLGLFYLNQVISEEISHQLLEQGNWERLSMHNPNNISIMPNKEDIKEDNRIKDWDKNVILKTDKTEQVLEKCSSCELNSNKGKEVCFSWIWKEDIQGVYSKIQNVANQKVLPVPKELTVEASLARHLVKSQISNK
ncbi:32034_t:CDS:2, partial [Gigaspora margarita]